MFDTLIANSSVSVGDADVRVRQHEGAGLAVEREAVYAVADGEHEHRGRAVDREAGRDLAASRAAGRPARRARRCVGRLRAAQHREDRADRDVDVDVRRAVERVEQQQVLAARDSASGSDAVRPSPRRRSRRGCRPIRSPRAGSRSRSRRASSAPRPARSAVPAIAEAVGERALADARADRLAGARDDLDQQAQVGVDRCRRCWRSIRNWVRVTRRIGGSILPGARRSRRPSTRTAAIDQNTGAMP